MSSCRRHHNHQCHHLLLVIIVSSSLSHPCRHHLIVVVIVSLFHRIIVIFSSSSSSSSSHCHHLIIVVVVSSSSCQRHIVVSLCRVVSCLVVSCCVVWCQVPLLVWGFSGPGTTPLWRVFLFFQHFRILINECCNTYHIKERCCNCCLFGIDFIICKKLLCDLKVFCSCIILIFLHAFLQCKLYLIAKMWATAMALERLRVTLRWSWKWRRWSWKFANVGFWTTQARSTSNGNQKNTRNCLTVFLDSHGWCFDF